MVLSNLIAAVVALTQRGKKHLHRVVSRHCACVPAPSRAIYGRLSPRWPEVQDHAACGAWGQRLVLNQVWLQGRRANALCWAHIEALAGQFASLWLPDVPPCSEPRRLGGRLSHTTFAHATLSHTTLLHATFSHTTRSHSYSYSYTTISQLPHTQLLHTQLLHPHTSQRSHAHTHTTFPHIFKINFCTYRCSTSSFVFPPFPVPLQILLLIIERSWLLGLPGPLLGRWALSVAFRAMAQMTQELQTLDCAFRRAKNAFAHQTLMEMAQSPEDRSKDVESTIERCWDMFCFVRWHHGINTWICLQCTYTHHILARAPHRRCGKRGC